MSRNNRNATEAYTPATSRPCCSGSRGIGRDRTSKAPLARGIRAPVVEAASALLAMASGEDHAFEQWWGREARLAELAEHDFCDRVGGVEPHVVGEQERPHGMTAAEPHRGVDVVTAREALLVHSDRVQH